MLLDDGTGKKNEPRMALPVRVPQSVLEAVYRRAGWKKVGEKWIGLRGTVTPVIESALRLFEHLSEAMQKDKLRWQQYAIDEKLDWTTQWPEVVARAAKLGLETAEKKRK